MAVKNGYSKKIDSIKKKIKKLGVFEIEDLPKESNNADRRLDQINNCLDSEFFYYFFKIQELSMKYLYFSSLGFLLNLYASML